MKKQYSSDLKVKAVKYYLKIKNYTKTCKIFECSIRSLKRWVEKYNKTGDVKRKKRNELSYKITKEHIKFIKDIVKKDPDIFMENLRKKLIKKYPDLSISRQYLSVLLRDNNITRKRATIRHFPKTLRGKPRYEKAELKVFFDKINKYKLEDLISIDETSLSSSLKFNYCRERLGKRCILKTDNNIVFRKYSLLVAISNKKCMKYKLYEKGSVNGDRFNEFMKELCSKIKNKLIILDNAKIHKTSEIKDIIKKSGNDVIYTVPYHPRLNCIEQWFNQLKHYIKLDKPMSFKKLEKSLKNSILKIKKENYKNYFIYAYNKDYYKNKIRKASTKLRKLKKYKSGI